MPTACMNAYMIVEPTNLKPRAFSAFENASDSGVRAGTSFIVRRAFTIGAPPTKLHANFAKLPDSSCTSRNAFAFAIAASILSRLRTIPASASSRRLSAAV